MKQLPFYDAPTFPLVPLSKNANDTVHMTEIVSFLKWILTRDKLEIANYLGEIKDESFFMVAATGLGKTVGVPVHVLIRQIQRTGMYADPHPKVWIVEPRIPIATEQEEYMNQLWAEYCLKHSRTKRRRPPLFGCRTSTLKKNLDAPIQFVTTGIFELQATHGQLDPLQDRVVIDEAHVTVEQNHGVEFAIALAHKAGVTVDYMSATVDTTGLQEDLHVENIIRADKSRNIIWKTNLQSTLDESLVEMVEKTLVSPDRNSRFFPDNEYKNADKVIESALSPGRSHGMLIVVNSFNGEASDIRKYSKKIQKAFPNLPVLHLASDVVRSARHQAEFRNTLRSIEQRQQNYVILSTSVVEMGITFPTLDYLVTMDSGYDQETIGDVTFPVIAPLGVNSLLQRIGRVGRKQPGIAYISSEVGADYSSLEDKDLNRGALSYEPIRYPLLSASLMPLAFHAVQYGITDIDAWLRELQLPSKIQESTDRMEYFHEQIEKLEQLGIAKNGQLTELGKNMSQWIGRADIAYATHLQRRFIEGASYEEVLFWIVATALSNTSAASLKAQHSYFVDYNGEYSQLANRIDIWSGTRQEDIAVFKAIATANQSFPGYLWQPKLRNSLTERRFRNWASWSGIDARKLTRAAQAITDTMKLFVRINAKDENGEKNEEFIKLFRGVTPLPERIRWNEVYAKIDTDVLERELSELSGSTRILITREDKTGPFQWKDEKHGHEGLIGQDDTPIKLVTDAVYTARVVPSRESKSAEASWRLTSLGYLHAAEKSTTQPTKAPWANKVELSSPTPAPVTTPAPTPASPPRPNVVIHNTPPSAPKKKSFWGKLFGL